MASGTYSGVVEFGSGVMIGRPVSGNLTTNPTPRQMGILQEGSIEFDATLKELHGAFQYSLVTARGKISAKGKAKFAALDIGVLSDLFFGLNSSVGKKIPLVGPNAEGPTAIPATPFQITVANGANFDQDYGVINAATGQPFTLISGGTPTAGQYKFSNAGVYTFAAADNVSVISVLINYTYTSTAVTSGTIELTNQLLGYAPEFELLFVSNFRGKQCVFRMYKATAGKIMFPTKQEDFVMEDMDFALSANAAGSIGTIWADLS